MKKTNTEQTNNYIPENLNIPPCFCGAAAELVHVTREVREGQIHFYGVKCARNHRIPTAFGYPQGAIKFWSECLNNRR